MTKEDINKIIKFIEKTNNIPDELLSDDKRKLATLDTKEILFKTLDEEVKNANNLKLSIEGFFRAHSGDSSIYVKSIEDIIFEIRYNSSMQFFSKGDLEGTVIGKHEYSNHHWLENKKNLLKTLEKAKIEFEEKLRIGNQQNSIKSFFKSNQARGIVLTALLGLFAGISSKDFIYDKISWSKIGSAFPNFEVVEFKRYVDLREWTPTLTDNENDLSGKAIYDDNFIVRKIRDEGKDFCLTAGSSGSNPDFTSQTHKIKQTAIDMKLEGWPNLKNQVLAILDVSKEKSNTTFKANIRSVRYRGFKDMKANWCSVGIWHSTQKLIYHVDFPKGKMGNSFSYSTSFFYDRNNFQKIQPDNLHIAIDSTSLTWTIEHPIIGNAYRIDWNW